jgi:peptide chain release factor 3
MRGKPSHNEDASLLRISDVFEYAAIPRFSPECFDRLINQDIARHKLFHKGLKQLEEEGVVQVLHAADQMRREPILAAVGELQFDVAEARLRGEYGVEITIERLPTIWDSTCGRHS